MVLLACWTGYRLSTPPVPKIGPTKGEFVLLDPHEPFAWIERELSKKQPVQYSLVDEAGECFVRAKSSAAASMWTRHVEFDLAEFPFVEWTWRVNRPVEGEDLDRKGGNDCSARILFGFKGDWSKANFFEQQAVAKEVAKTGYEPPGKLLVYVFSLGKEPEAVIPDPHLGDRARILVASSGGNGLGKWRTVRRNLAEDYRRAFGSDPPPVVSVALMTDTDDTHSTAEADYGKIILRKR